MLTFNKSPNRARQRVRKYSQAAAFTAEIFLNEWRTLSSPDLKMTTSAAYCSFENAYKTQIMVIKCKQEWLFSGAESTTGMAL